MAFGIPEKNIKPKMMPSAQRSTQPVRASRPVGQGSGPTRTIPPGSSIGSPQSYMPNNKRQTPEDEEELIRKKRKAALSKHMLHVQHQQHMANVKNNPKKYG